MKENKIVFPKIEKILYQGVDLSGEWFCKGYDNDHEEGENNFELNMNLKQSGFHLTGDITLKSKFIIKNKEKDMYSYFIIDSGTVKESFVLLNYKAKSKKKTTIGTALLNIKENGNKLKGLSLYIADSTATVKSVSNTFERI